MSAFCEPGGLGLLRSEKVLAAPGDLKEPSRRFAVRLCHHNTTTFLMLTQLLLQVHFDGLHNAAMTSSRPVAPSISIAFGAIQFYDAIATNRRASSFSP